VEHNKMIEISQMVIEEMNKFSTEHVQNEVELAKVIVDAGLPGLINVDKSVIDDAKRMSKTTKEEKQIRKEAIGLAKDRLTSKKLIYKNYKDGIEVFDTSVFDKLFEQEDEAEDNLETAYQMLFDAQSKKEKYEIKQAKLDVRNVKITRNAIRRAIKVATNRHSLYRRSTKPYQDAVKLLKQKENYQHFDEIAAMFDEANARKEEAERLKNEEAAKEKADRLAEIERLRHEKEIAKQGRLNGKSGKNEKSVIRKKKKDKNNKDDKNE